MQKVDSPPLTRFNIVMWFLRVHLWISFVGGCAGIVAGALYALSPVGFRFGIQGFGLSAFSVLILWVFPTILASNSLGETERQVVASAADFRFLTARCAGLALFVGSLSNILFFSISALYFIVTNLDKSPLQAVFGSSTSGGYIWISVAQMAGMFLSTTVGFFLAFGPAIFGNFRSR